MTAPQNNPHLESARNDNPFERVGRLLMREGHSPQKVDGLVQDYRNFLQLVISGNIQETREAATEGVMAAWDLSRLDTIAYEKLIQSMGITMPISPRIQPLARNEQQIGMKNFDWTSLEHNLQIHDGMTAGNAKASVADFQDYLAQQIWSSGENSSPSKLADKAWHRVILDSKGYNALQAQVLGFRMHHIPTIGHMKVKEMMSNDDCKPPCDSCESTLETKRATIEECGGCANDDCGEVKQGKIASMELGKKDCICEHKAGNCDWRYDDRRDVYRDGPHGERIYRDREPRRRHEDEQWRRKQDEINGKCAKYER